jgi:hypothetical protein
MINNNVYASASRLSINAQAITPVQDIKCAMCGTTTLQIVGDVIVLRARHHGDHHTTILSIRDLYDRLTPFVVPA